jgi:hypothetical protein
MARLKWHGVQLLLHADQLREPLSVEMQLGASCQCFWNILNYSVDVMVIHLRKIATITLHCL